MPSSELNILAVGMGWPSAQPGGLNTYFSSVCRQLAARHQLRALVCADGGSIDTDCDSLRVTNIADPGWSLKRRREAFRRHAAAMMDERKIDIVYTHFAPYGIGPALEAKRRGIPVVMAFHGPWSEEIKVEGSGLRQRLKARTAFWIEKRTYALADAFVVLSGTFRDMLHRVYGVPLDQIRVVPGAADTDRFVPHPDPGARKSELGLDELPTVLTVRRLVHRMGLLQLVDAWKEVAARMPDARLLIGGKGPLKEELERRIAGYGLQRQIRLLGYVPDELLPHYYQAADLFVVPTQALEGFGLITVEALASGTPVVATPVGGSREILDRFRPDLLLRGKDDRAIAAGLLQALARRGQLPTAEQCRRHVMEHYTWQAVTGKVEALFAEFAAGGGVGRPGDRRAWTPARAEGRT